MAPVQRGDAGGPPCDREESSCRSSEAESVRGSSIVMRTAVHSLIESATHTHHPAACLPACRGCTAENGRLASIKRPAEGKTQWTGTQITRRITEITPDRAHKWPIIRAHNDRYFSPEHLQGELQKRAIIRAFICIIDVAVANYRPAENRWENVPFSIE